jgi:magnesium chelatase family protein
MLVRTHSFAVSRGITEHVLVELDVRRGLPSFSVVGLAGAAARDARERVQAAVVNTGLVIPRQRVTVNLAPASSRRIGAEFDLAIACCVVAAQHQIDAVRLARVALFAELGLGGQLRACPGAALVAVAAQDAGLAGLIVSSEDAVDARLAHELPVAGAGHLREVLNILAPARRRHAGPAPAAAPGAGADPVDRYAGGLGGRAGPAAQAARAAAADRPAGGAR